MSFSVPAQSYDRFMGRYSNLLATPFADLAGVGSSGRVLDVGCGPGALLVELIARVGARQVVGVDPSEHFVDAVRQRHPTTEVHRATAEALPFEDGEFDASLAQLVVHFMTDPVVGLAEMARVTRPGGTVAACVWDFGEGGSPLSPFWTAAAEVDPGAPGEAHLPGTHRGQLAELFEQAGLADVTSTSLTVTVEHPTFDDWWQPYELGVGPPGSYVAGCTPDERQRLIEHCRTRLGDGPFTISATAWAARGTVR